MGRFHKRLSINSSIFILLTTALFFSYPIFGKEPKWFYQLKKIEILKSTKQDIEKLFPSLTSKLSVKHKFKNSEEIHYLLKEESLFVSYSLQKCFSSSAENERFSYNVDKDTLLFLAYHPKKPVKISKLKLDLSSFKSYKETDTENFIYYNDDLGLRYGIADSKINSIEIFPSSSMKNLLCNP